MFTIQPVPAVWKNWMPGVLCDRQVRELVKDGCLMNLEAESDHIDLSAINLELDCQVWQMKRGAIKPFGGNYLFFLQNNGYAEEVPFEDVITLQTRTTYVFKLKLEFSTDFTRPRRFYGHATGRSSIGRVDVLTRLIVDGMDEYEGFGTDRLAQHGSGKLFLEVTPITFPVLVKPGIALSQLRLFFGTPEGCLIKGPDIVETTLGVSATQGSGGILCLSLEPEGADNISAFRADLEKVIQKEGDKDIRSPVPLWERDEPEKPNPKEYWARVKAESGVKDREWFLKIDHGRFYILKSLEKLSLPSGVAVYCKPSDETIGEMRIHYAGFVHPWFGLNRKDGKEGTPLIFEVRGHDLPLVLGHGEKMARLEYYRMSEDPERPKKKQQSRYENQSLELSKFFQEWNA